MTLATAVGVYGVSALVAAYEALDTPVSASGRLRCSSCGGQYVQGRLGVELCSRSVGGELRAFECGCARRR